MITQTTIKAMLNNKRSRMALKRAIMNVYHKGYTVTPITNKNGCEWLTVSHKKGKLLVIDRQGKNHTQKIFDLVLNK